MPEHHLVKGVIVGKTLTHHKRAKKNYKSSISLNGFQQIKLSFNAKQFLMLHAL